MSYIIAPETQINVYYSRDTNGANYNVTASILLQDYQTEKFLNTTFSLVTIGECCITQLKGSALLSICDWIDRNISEPTEVEIRPTTATSLFGLGLGRSAGAFKDYYSKFDCDLGSKALENPNHLVWEFGKIKRVPLARWGFTLPGCWSFFGAGPAITLE